MAKVVELAEGENPPEGESWVLVVREEAVRSPGTNITQHSDGATFAISPDETDGSEAIAEATRWADENNIATVYVRLG